MTSADSPRRAGSSSIVRGAFAGLAGGLAMNLYARTVLALAGREAHDAAPGADRTGRGMQPPQADGPASRDAAVRMGTGVARIFTKGELDRDARIAAGVATHYVFSAAVGAAYAWFRLRQPAAGAARGAMYGAAIWLISDVVLMSVTGLGRKRWQESMTLHTYSLGGHLVYGAVLDAALRVRIADDGARGRAIPAW